MGNVDRQNKTSLIINAAFYSPSVHPAGETSPPRTDLLPAAPALQPPAAGRRADGGAERRLQVSQRQRPVHGPKDPSGAPPAQSRPAAGEEADQVRQAVEGLGPEAVPDPRVRLRGPHGRCRRDDEVKGLLLPADGEDEVAPAGLRVSEQEVAVVHHQALGHLTGREGVDVDRRKVVQLVQTSQASPMFRFKSYNEEMIQSIYFPFTQDVIHLPKCV